MTKLTWDNAILIGPKMAERLQIKTKDVVELELNGKKVHGPGLDSGRASRQFGHRILGYGRKRAGRVGTAQGFDAYLCAPAPRRGSPPACKFARPATTYKLASTQGMQWMDTPDGDHRPLVRETTLEEYRKEPNFAKERTKTPRPDSRSTSLIRIKRKITRGAWRLT